MKTVKTPKGTDLPLTNLKGKDYLMVGYRLQWFNEEVSNFYIDTELLQVTDEQTVARATVSVFDKDGKAVRRATATKRETKKDFADHTEKAETSAIGRALAMLGYGTQFALSDLDEGHRLADSPLVDAKSEVKKEAAPVKTEQKAESVEEPKKSSSFNKNKKAPPVSQPEEPVVAAGEWE